MSDHDGHDVVNLTALPSDPEPAGAAPTEANR
jgi:hypothetical protein